MAWLACLLRFSLSSTSVTCDRLGTVLTLERSIERVPVVGFVANVPDRGFIKKTDGKNFFHKLALGDYVLWTDTARGKPLPAACRRSWPLATTGRSNGKAQVFALAKVTSTNASSQLSLPPHTDAAPKASAPPPASCSESTARTGDRRSGMVETSPAIPATELACPTPRTLHSAPALQSPTVLRSTPESCYRRLRKYSAPLQNAAFPISGCLRD